MENSSLLFDLVLALSLLSIGVVPVVLWARHRWKKLGPEIFPALDKDHTNHARNNPSATRVQSAARLITRVRALLDQETAAEARSGAELLKKIEASSAEAAPLIDNLIASALETADVSSLLLATGNGQFLYAVAIPNRHEHPHLLRRYEAFSSGWRRHAEQMRASLTASGEFSILTAVLLFLSPEGRESALRISCVGPDSILVPPTLMDAHDVKAAAVKPFDASLEFSLAA